MEQKRMKDVIYKEIKELELEMEESDDLQEYIEIVKIGDCFDDDNDCLSDCVYVDNIDASKDDEQQLCLTENNIDCLIM